MNLCVFCEIISGNIKARKIYETKHSIALLDAFPLKEGHTLIVSKNHKTKVEDLTVEENNDIFTTLHFLISHIEKILESNSSLIAIHNGKEAGQEIPHLHVHIVPIKESDRATAIHTMFAKEKITEKKLDEIWVKMVSTMQEQN